MNEQSTCEWPAGAIPRQWVEALFSRMAMFFGTRFASLWNDVDLRGVKATWGIELGKLSREQLKAGVDNMAQLAKPPTLPEFVAHCRSSRQEQVTQLTPKLGDERRADRAVVDRNLTRIRSAEKALAGTPSAEWAFRLLLRGTEDRPMTIEVRRAAVDAVLSFAGKRVITGCQNAELRREYEGLRQRLGGEQEPHVEAA